MMSKNSFWASMRENLKRRNWIAVIYSVIFLLSFPVGMTLWITSFSSRKEMMPLAEWKEDMVIGLSEYLSINILVTLLVTIMAIICAIQGFSYLFRRQKMDMYMSVPVSKERRFAVIYLNGILLFALPYLFSLLIGLCISGANGILTIEVVKSMLYSYLAYLIYYVAIYNITIIAVMLTGNLLVSLCATAVFLFYEIMIKGIIFILCSAFLHTYSNYSSDLKVHFSPMIMMFEKSVFLGNNIISVPRLIEQTGMTMGKILMIGIGTGIIAYLLYAIRPAESCNKAIAFGKTKPIIKIGLMVPISLIVGVLFYAITDANIAMTVFGFMIGIVLSHSIMEIIFAFDLKAAIKHLASGAVGAVLVFTIFIVFKFDLTGYDKWVPNPQKVESIALDLPVFFDTGYYDFENDYWSGSAEYKFDHMELTDTENICAFMESVMSEDVESVAEEGENFLWGTVKYRMKNGKEKYRSIHFPVEKYMDELNDIISGEEYQKGNYQLLGEEFSKYARIKNIEFTNGVWREEVEEDDIERVFENYKADLMNYDLKTIVNEFPIGVIYIEYENVNYNVNTTYNGTHTYSMPVYASFEKTKAYTDEHGHLKDWKTKSEYIDVITISHWDEMSRESVDRDFGDKEDIQEILPAIIPGELANYRYFMEEPDYTYDAFVSFNGEAGDEWIDFSSYFYVFSSKLPDFAK
ncbi:MAG: hypothetical protein IJN54_09100 [Lachnospiraceae bacterium]|nr:hypothetical protein [Lachnospiraceae bacterium]